MSRFSLRLPTPRFATLAGLAIALATGLALLSLGTSLLDPSARAETIFLAKWVFAALLPAALALSAATSEIGLTALALTVAAWLLPAGPQRGAAVGLLLVAGLALALARDLREVAASPRSLRFPLFALALAVLAFPGAFLQPRLPALLLGVAAPALLTGLAAASLVDARGELGLIAAATAVAAAGGPGWSAAVALAALAVGEQCRRERLKPALGVVMLACAALPLRDEPLPALCTVAAGLALSFERKALRAALLGCLALASALLGAMHLGAIVGLLVLVPAAAFGERVAERFGELALSLALSALLVFVGGPALLPVACAFALLTVEPRPQHLALQASWSAWLLAAVMLTAAYPWLRPEPRASALALWHLETPASSGLSPSTIATALIPVLALGALAALLAGWKNRGAATGGWGRAALPALALLALLLARPALPPLAEGPRVLSAQEPGWRASGGAEAGRALEIDAALSNAQLAERGAPVAKLHLGYSDGTHEERPLRAGVELDEWAAQRPDVARALGKSIPAWVSWVAPDGTFFAQRYRARISIGEREPTSLELRREESLPEPVTIAVYRIGAVP